jgi:hypothetical protein
MTIRTYARVADGKVFELLRSDGDIAAMFHPEIRWVDVTDLRAEGHGVDVGWVQTADGFIAPPPSVPPQALAAPNLAELRAEVARLSTLVASLAKTPAAAG